MEKKSQTKALAKSLIEWRPITGLILPILAVFPPILISIALIPTPPASGTTPSSQTVTQPAPPSGKAGEFRASLKRFFEDHPNVRSLGLGWPICVIIFTYFGGWLRSKIKGRDMTAEELGFLLRALDRPVGKKLTRFAEAVRDKQTGRLSCDIFHAITMPNEQISLLIEALHLVFQQDLDDSDQLKVVLARMKNKRVDAFEYYLPSTEGGPRTSVDELRVKESGFSRAAELQQIIIVPDLAKEMAKTKKSRNCVKGQRGRVTQAP